MVGAQEFAVRQRHVIRDGLPEPFGAISSLRRPLLGQKLRSRFEAQMTTLITGLGFSREYLVSFMGTLGQCTHRVAEFT